MPKKQLLALFVCSLSPWTVAYALFYSLPILATKLGASSTQTGAYLASCFASLAGGSLTAGWLGDRFRCRKSLLIFVGMVSIPITLLINQTADLIQLMLVTVPIWFSLGTSFALLEALVGLSITSSERGHFFSIISISVSLGAILAGITGTIVGHFGVLLLFPVIGLFWVIQPLAGLFLTEAIVADVPTPSSPLPMKNHATLSHVFHLILVANFLYWIASSVAGIGRPLVMHSLNFGIAPILSASAFGGLVTLPLRLVFGRVADRISHKLAIPAFYSLAILSLLILTFSLSAWQFWLATTLAFIADTNRSVIGSAWISKLTPRAALGKRLAWYSATSWVGQIIGFACAGYAFQGLGTITFVITALLPLIAIIVLLPVIRLEQPLLN
ncbi:MAG: MFS transporter [Anaerolineae bacterium]|nr:MFS transporter [Anaerolineae bacterium]